MLILSKAAKLFIVFKMAYSCCFSLRINLDFPEFVQKKFITSTAGALAIFDLHERSCLSL